MTEKHGNAHKKSKVTLDYNLFSLLIFLK